MTRYLPARHYRWFGISAVVLAGLCGCGHTAKITGKVTYQGRPVRYGKDGRMGILVRGMEPQAVEIGAGGVSEGDLLVHDDSPILSVADLDRRLKRAVEGAAGDVWVEGEVSGAKPASSGHVYFLLKDEREDASIECVMYRSASLRSRQLMRDGARVQLRGRATVWAPRGRLQFTAEHARPAGRGALLEALEALKTRLLAEGLFAPERKRSLPSDPRVIGVVTSRSGAVIHDITKVAFRRGAVRIILSPALVQGPAAALHLIEALDLLEQLRDLDVIIIGRGGGSADDLMVFNDEAVVRGVHRIGLVIWGKRPMGHTFGVSGVL